MDIRNVVKGMKVIVKNPTEYCTTYSLEEMMYMIGVVQNISASCVELKFSDKKCNRCKENGECLWEPHEFEVFETNRNGSNK